MKKKKKVKHHTTHKKKKSSKFSLFKHKVADVFNEIIEVPDEPEKIETEELSHSEKLPEITKEEMDEFDIREKEIKIRKEEVERRRDVKHEEIISNLSQAVSKWKETGDIGIHLKAPVPLRERVLSFLSRIKRSPVVGTLQSKAEDVAEKVNVRVEEAKEAGEKPDTKIIVKEEWDKVLHRMEEVGDATERKEIEKIYKELSEDN